MEHVHGYLCLVSAPPPHSHVLNILLSSSWSFTHFPHYFSLGENVGKIEGNWGFQVDVASMAVNLVWEG